MKKSIVTIAILASGFLAGTVLTTSCTGKKAEQEQKESEEHEHDESKPHEHAEGDEHETVYACPMHPEVTGKEGEKCSKCGMKLEAVKSSDSTEAHHDH